MIPVLLFIVTVLFFVTKKDEGQISTDDSTIIGDIVNTVEGTVGNFFNDAQWLPLNADLKSASRDPVTYYEICKQFDVVNQKRYARTINATFCNIYVWDCSIALKCEIPHWYSEEDDSPCIVGHGKEMDANDMCLWLSRNWKPQTMAQAFERAANGFPVVIAYYNPGKIGHVAMLLPNGNIAQAGAHNYFDEPMGKGFGNLSVQYYSHD